VFLGDRSLSPNVARSEVDCRETVSDFRSGTKILNQTVNAGIQEADQTKGEAWLT
jgi:hypothetical protein